MPLGLERELSLEEKERIKTEYNYTCLCCGKTGKKDLQLDHINPFIWGGQTCLENFQPLCRECNKIKGTNEIDFRDKVSHLRRPKSKLKLYRRHNGEDIELNLRRIINVFYNCQAVSNIMIGRISCDIKLNNVISSENLKNDSEWLMIYENQLIKHIWDEFGLEIRTINVSESIEEI
jgi:hypothetical protein